MKAERVRAGGYRGKEEEGGRQMGHRETERETEEGAASGCVPLGEFTDTPLPAPGLQAPPLQNGVMVTTSTPQGRT